jgi:hypothetical protein
MVGPQSPPRFLRISFRELLIVVAWFAVVFAVLPPIVRGWQIEDWIDQLVSALCLSPFAVLLVMLYRGKQPDQPDSTDSPEP